MVADPRVDLRDGVPGGDARHGARALVVGGLRVAGRVAGRVLLRRTGYRRDLLHAVVAGLRVHPARDAPDVPVLGDLLPAVGVLAGSPAPRAGDTALQRRGPAAVADARRRRSRDARARRLPGGARRRRRRRGLPPLGPAPAAVTESA